MCVEGAMERRRSRDPDPRSASRSTSRGSISRSRTISGARHGERELPFVIRVGRIHQQDGVARIEQRAKQIVRELRAAGADRDVLGAETRHAEQVRVESRELLPALDVAKRCRVATALVKRRSVRDDLEIRLPQRFGRGMIHPAAAERDHVLRIQAHREDVLALGHLHDLADRRRARDLLAHQLRERG